MTEPETEPSPGIESASVIAIPGGSFDFTLTLPAGVELVRLYPLLDNGPQGPVTRLDVEKKGQTYEVRVAWQINLVSDDDAIKPPEQGLSGIWDRANQWAVGVVGEGEDAAALAEELAANLKRR